jgi:hypothetical protein
MTQPDEFTREMLRKSPLHKGLAASSLIDKLLAAPGKDPWSLDLTEEESSMLGRILAENPDVPTIDEVQSSLAWLGRRRLARNSERLDRALSSADKEPADDLNLLKQVARKATRLLRED